MAIIYGVDTNKPITFLMVRGAIEECFFQAHQKQAGLGDSGEKVARNYCREVVRSAFKETGGNYNEPTRESIVEVVDYLAKFSKTLREEEVVQKHQQEILSLVESVE